MKQAGSSNPKEVETTFNQFLSSGDLYFVNTRWGIYGIEGNDLMVSDKVMTLGKFKYLVVIKGTVEGTLKIRNLKYKNILRSKDYSKSGGTVVRLKGQIDTISIKRGISSRKNGETYRRRTQTSGKYSLNTILITLKDASSPDYKINSPGGRK